MAELASPKKKQKVEKKEETKFTSRTVAKDFLSIEEKEGAGAIVRRGIGLESYRNFDPFLILDDFKVGLPAGFPDHPHRGFETVTYILPDSEGNFTHEDFIGCKGQLVAGDVQWMTAGVGVMHSEMPESEKECHGIQIWINLDQKNKACAPRYKDVHTKDIPKASKDGVSVSVIAGEALGVKFQHPNVTPVGYYHFKMEPHSTLNQPLPQDWNSFVYILSGDGGVYGGTKADRFYTLILNQDGEGLTVEAGDSAIEFLLLAGQSTNEPIIRGGLFVTNTTEELEKARSDYKNFTNGYERGKGWYSKNGLPITHKDKQQETTS